MKTFKRGKEPQEIKYNKKCYVRSLVDNELEAKAKKCICVKVFPTKLIGRKDLDGNFHKSRVLYFEEKKKKHDSID